MTGDMFLGGNVFYRGGFFFASDERLKKEIEPLTDALDVLLKLRGRRFLWAEADQSGAPSTAQMGLVAQEVENVFPEWVREDPYGNKSVSLKGFEALAIEALREMKQEIDDIKARLDKLKG
jgi:hypothetical protein